MNSTTLPAVVTFDGAELSIIDHNGTPWLSGADLSRALGYADGRSVAKIYRRNNAEFSQGMSVVVNLTPTGGIPTETRIFSPRGAHLVAMFARTPKAAAFRRWVLDVLEGLAVPKRVPAPERPALPPPTIDPALQERIHRRAGTLAGLHYTDCVQQMNRQRHLPPVCFNPDQWSPIPHVSEAIADLDTIIGVLDVFTRKLASHRAALARTQGAAP